MTQNFVAIDAGQEDRIICTAFYCPETGSKPPYTKSGYGNVKNGYLPDPSILFDVLKRSKTITSISVKLKQ